ncbi:MAG: DUF1772 domain-containing protein [Ferruginibacter sp.]
MSKLVSFLNIVITGLFVGAMVGFARAYNPTGYSLLNYLQQQQGAIQSLRNVTGIISLVSFVLTISAVFLEKKNKVNRILLVIAAAFFIICWLVMLLGIQPLNTMIITWKSTNVPPNWTEVRDEWWFYHQLRTTFSFLAFCLIVAVTVRKSN